MSRRPGCAVSSILIASFALSLTACGQDTPAPPPVGWEVNSGEGDGGARVDVGLDAGGDSGPHVGVDADVASDSGADVGVDVGVDSGADVGVDAGEDTGPEDRDSDFDGLSDAEEATLCTDPTNYDTDGDGLSDYDELQSGTDPCAADSDGDGLSDGDEFYFQLDPNVADTRRDGVRDGDRFITTACDTPLAGPITITRSGPGDWRLATPEDVVVDPEPTFTTTPPPGTFVTFSGPRGAVAGFAFSEPARGGQDALGRPTVYHDAVVASGQVVSQDLGATFATHERSNAFTATYTLATPTPEGLLDLRNRLLFAMAGGFEAGDFTAPPTGGAEASEHRVVVSVVERVADRVVLVAVTDAQGASVEDLTLADQLTDTTHVAYASSSEGQTCYPRVFTRGQGEDAALALPSTPISSSLRVWMKRPGATGPELVPLNGTHGYTYAPDMNRIRFHGGYAPPPSVQSCAVQSDCVGGSYCFEGTCVFVADVAFHYEVFRSRRPARP